MYVNKKFIFSFIAFVLVAFSVAAQQERNDGFGQNRVQHRSFDWYYYSTDKFDIYYYEGGKDYARLALDYLNKEYNRITDVIGYAPFNKTIIFLYNSYTDLQQSNIGVEGDQFTIAGQTNFVKLQLEVAYPGSAQKFKEEITYKLTKILLDDMMFGGSLAERFQSAYLLSLANWFTEGAARYVTYGWSVEMDDYIRDFLARKNLKKLARLDENDAGFIGQSVWNYIAVKYGTGNISNILNLTRYTRKEENSIASTLGLRFQTFVYEWQNYYLLGGQSMDQYTAPNRENMIVSKKNPDYKFSQVRVNSAGTKLAYAVNYEGTYKVIVEDIETGKKNTVLKGGYRVLTQESNYNIPLIDWLNEQTIGFIYDKSGMFFIGSYELETKERFEKPLPKFDQIHDFSFNYNGKLAILSANTDKRNDLFLVSMRRSAIKRLTNDLFDDIHPRFVPGTDAIVFSSNRNTRFLDEAKDITALADLDDNLDLFIYDLDTTQNELHHLTKTIGRDYYPVPQNSETIFFLSDQKGNSNLYRYSLRDSTYNQVTNFNKSIIEFDLNGVNDEFTFLMLDGGVKRIFLDKQFDLLKSNFTTFTPRQNVLQARALVKRISERNQQSEVTPEKPVVKVQKDPLLPDSLLAKEEPIITDTASTKDDSYVDADDFVFEEEAKFKNESLSFLSILGNLEAEPTVIGPLKYSPRFSMDNITTSFVIDPVRNFGILLEAGMSDLLENHKLYGGMLFMTNFRNGDLFGEYQYLKHRVDFKLRFDRKVILFDLNPEQSLAQKYSLNSITFGASYPINNALRVSFNPFFAFTNFSNLERNFVIGNPGQVQFAPNDTQNYGGFKSEVVFDNTKIYALNLYEGTRGKLSFSSFTGLTDIDKSFTNVTFDLRNYKRLHREITFATRLFYNGFFGKNKQNNLLGGVDNWIFRGDDPVRLEDDRSVPPNYPFILRNETDNSGILFSEVVSNLRGFNFGRLFGSNVLLFNAELRFPVFLYLSDGPIASNFLRNFQLVGFYDFGSAWTGTPPLNRDNSVNTFRVETDTQFDATIKSFRNPWLSSYGFGLRTVVLGYYVRLDWARPVENFEAGDFRFHLSLGYDF